MALDTRQEPREATSGSDVRERDEQRGIRNPRVEYKKQLEEEARERYEERTRRRVMDSSGTKVPAEDLEAEPSTVPVSSMGRHSIEHPPGDIPAGTRPTVSEEFRERQYSNPYARESVPEQKAPQRTGAVEVEQREAAQRRKQETKAKQQPARGEGMGFKRLRRMSRVTFATWAALGICLPLYGYQVFWTIIFLMGWGIESNVIHVVDLVGVGNTVTRFIEDMVSWVVPGATLAVIGWILATLLGILQMAITFCIYMVRGINPLQGAAPFTVFILVLAIYFLPIGLLPWVVLWMGAVLDHSRERK